MSISYSPSIVTNGLFFYLDAANTKSYSGSGTNWTSLIAKENSTLTNSPTYSTANNGIITFDGVNDYVILPVNLFNHDAGTPFSISIWFKTSVSGGILLGQTNSSDFVNASGYVPGIYINTNGNLVTSCFWGSSTTNASTSSIIVSDNAWHNVTVTFASATQKSYLDGNLYATLSKTQANYSTNYYYFLSTGKSSGWAGSSTNTYFTGSISLMSFYSKELTDLEVLLNFNALKGRFSI